MPVPLEWPDLAKSGSLFDYGIQPEGTEKKWPLAQGERDSDRQFRKLNEPKNRSRDPNLAKTLQSVTGVTDPPLRLMLNSQSCLSG